jgi:hypothetical protein
MIVKKKRIRNVEGYISHLKDDQSFRVGLISPERFGTKLVRAGFSSPLIESEMVLPSSTFGKVSLYNAEGKYIVRRDLPMETAYRQGEWTWEQWVGRDQTETHSKIVDIPYQRYPRDFQSPPSIELSIGKDTAGNLVVLSPSLKIGQTDPDTLKHIANLFLEIFGEFILLDDSGDNFLRTEIKRLNWELLPKGKKPWGEVKSAVKEIINTARKGNRVVINHRLEKINNYGADFVAIGKAGFRGYIIFGFETTKTYILESIYYGNATYVFDAKWEDLSRLTKAEILNNDLQDEWLIHRKGWGKNLTDFMTKRGVI